MTNQVATGLALTIFAIGFSGLAGAPLVGKTAESRLLIFQCCYIPDWELFFQQDILFYLAFVIIATSLFKKAVDDLRAVDIDAHALGHMWCVRWQWPLAALALV